MLRIEKQRRWVKFLRKHRKALSRIIVAVIVIIIIAIGIKIGIDAIQSNDATPASVKYIKQQALPADSPLEVSITHVSTPAHPGDPAFVTVLTKVGATCTMTLTYGRNVPAPGLSQQTADKTGIITWSWAVPESAQQGVWPMKITCAYNKKSSTETAHQQIIVQKQ